jgi:hypothetical protein
MVRKKFSRKQLLHFAANLQVELIGMEACGGAHFLGRVLREQSSVRVSTRPTYAICGIFPAFPIRDALRPELSWTHYRTLLRVDNDQARQWYMNEAANMLAALGTGCPVTHDSHESRNPLILQKSTE